MSVDPELVTCGGADETTVVLLQTPPRLAHPRDVTRRVTGDQGMVRHVVHDDRAGSHQGPATHLEGSDADSARPDRRSGTKVDSDLLPVVPGLGHAVRCHGARVPVVGEDDRWTDEGAVLHHCRCIDQSVVLHLDAITDDYSRVYVGTPPDHAAGADVRPFTHLGEAPNAGASADVGVVGYVGGGVDIGLGRHG
jgi:hypothetical protein